MKRVLAGCFLAISLSITPGFAARPFATDDAGVVEQGKFECEVAADYWQDAFAGSVGLKHGLTDRMDIGVSFGRTQLPFDERCFDCAALGMKFALIPDLFSATFMGKFGESDYGANLILSREFGLFAAHVNLGGSFISSTNDADLTYGIAGVFALGPVNAGLEIGGTHEAVDWWQVGGQWAILDWLALDIGVGGNFEKDISMNATTGLWFAFPIERN